MTIPKKSIGEIKELITALSTLNFSTITQRHWQGRTSVVDLERVMSEYGGTFISPPDDFFDYAECYDLKDRAGHLIDIPLWTINEGKSDLVITIELDSKSNEISISDLRVP